jgi:hypothetical protein
MKQAKKVELSPADEGETSPSLRDVASYLRGVADATAALSQRPGLAPIAVIAPLASVSSIRETMFEATATSARKTMPYDGQGVRGRTVPAPQRLDGLSFDLLDDPLGGDEPQAFVDERPSDVRLRVGKLSPEWYDLLNRRVG